MSDKNSFKSQPKVITNDNHLPIKNSHRAIQHSHLQNIENASFDDLVQGPQGGGGKLYVVNNNIKFRTKDKTPESIAAQLVAPSKKNCEYLISFGKKKQTLYKCVKVNGKVSKVTRLYNK